MFFINYYYYFQIFKLSFDILTSLDYIFHSNVLLNLKGNFNALNYFSNITNELQLLK
jgi:hypothetical protein